MLYFCLKCRKNAETKNPKVTKANKGELMSTSKCAVCDSKESRFIKEHEASGLLSNLRLKTPLIKIPILGDILF